MIDISQKNTKFILDLCKLVANIMYTDATMKVRGLPVPFVDMLHGAVMSMAEGQHES